MAQDYTYVEDNGTTTTKTRYSCSKKSLQYTIIGDDIKSDFDFLTNELTAKVNEALKYINDASVIQAFDFEGSGGSAKDISDAYTKVQTEVQKMVQLLDTLHSALYTDIDNINAELKANFGHWIFGKAVVAGKSTTTNPTN